MNCTCICYDIHGTESVLTECIRFSLLRERYLPFSSLSLTVRCGEMETPVRIRFLLDGRTLMDGTVHRADVSLRGGLRTLTATVRSFTAALAKNQLEPGVHYDVTLDSLMQTYALPHVTYQTGMAAVGYIYVKEHTPMWSAVSAYNFKLCGGFPYVRADNLLCVMPQPERDPVVLPDGLILRGEQCSSGAIVSRVVMASFDGEYGRYAADNPEAAAREIVSVRQMAFDMQFIYDPEDALRYQIALSNRRLSAETAAYSGYCGEDIGDAVTAGGKTAFVGKIVICGDSKGIVTEDTFYYDSFCNRALSAAS